MSCERRVKRSRECWIKDEKANHPGSQTSGELRRTLGLPESTFKNRIRKGRIPPAAYTSVSGWPLWSAEQVRAILHERIKHG